MVDINVRPQLIIRSANQMCKIVYDVTNGEKMADP